ncbi:MAG: Re/Si-specific NAD(P)(+) transhydrogenase subunit alpha, partial [Planctomycetaceae bacterium]
VPKETFPGERRVALVPATVGTLTKAGFSVRVESGAGEAAGFSDEDYTSHGALVVSDRAAVFAETSVILHVRVAGENPTAGAADHALLHAGQMVIGLCDPLSQPDSVRPFAERNVALFALELLPRITRAQSMDVLSSMSTITGYKAVLMAADALPRMFPMLMTAAGTITPARVFVMGAGVAGLQAIATAKRLGAVVRAFDIRPAVKEQVESLGARFVEVDLETADSETEGGYAKQMDEEFYRKQREKLTEVVAESDVVVTTAAIPGKTSPILVTEEMVRGMRPGSVIVDLAAQLGGNCELTHADETVCENGVTIFGPCNLPSTIPVHASEMYSRNIAAFLLSMVKEGRLRIDLDDEVVRETLLTQDGEVVGSRVRQLLRLDPAEEEPPPEVEETPAEQAGTAEANGDGTPEEEGAAEEPHSAGGIEN